MTGHTPVMKPSNGSTVTSFTKCVLPAGTYKFVSPMGSLNLYGMKIDYSTEKDSMPIDNAVNFQWQLDSTKTIVRFIGTLSGINDLTKLDNVYVDVVLINGTSNPHHASIEITKVYKAVIGSGDSTKETAVAGIYYAVCSISALDALKSTANTTDGVTGNWTIKSKLYYTYNDVDNVISTVSAVSGF